jgi:hypothetical protein
MGEKLPISPFVRALLEARLVPKVARSEQWIPAGHEIVLVIGGESVTEIMSGATRQAVMRRCVGAENLGADRRSI